MSRAARPNRGRPALQPRSRKGMTNLPDRRFLPPLMSRHFSIPSIAHCGVLHALEPVHGVIPFGYSWSGPAARSERMRARPDGPSLRQLRAFETVARRGSIGAAAKELGLSQPAVTQMIAQVESVLAA